jgi:MoxR-like ATPase
LVSGSPGTGKSSLARSVARWQGWPFYQKVITSRTQARDLLWRFDSLRRLGDAQVAGQDQDALQRLNNRFEYIEPEVLWWAFNPSSANGRGAPEDKPVTNLAVDPAEMLGPRPTCDWLSPDERTAHPKRAVVLLDEIDKADPDVPNDLLVPLGALQFEVAETETPVALADNMAPPLIIITNNRERDLPPAFLRRCIALNLPDPDVPWLVKIATRRFGDKDKALYEAVAQQMPLNHSPDNRVAAGTAEFLDAVRTCRHLKVAPTGPGAWERIRRATLVKGRVDEEQA